MNKDIVKKDENKIVDLFLSNVGSNIFVLNIYLKNGSRTV